jgi:hypothetical protein
MHPILWGMLGAFIDFAIFFVLAALYVAGRKRGREQGAQAVSEMLAPQVRDAVEKAYEAGHRDANVVVN